MVRQSLVLNATYEPLGVVSSRRATVLVLTEKAVTVEDGGDVLHSVSRVIIVPAERVERLAVDSASIMAMVVSGGVSAPVARR